MNESVTTKRRARSERILKLAFTADMAEAAAVAFSFNCGPASVCAITGLTPNQLRPYLGDFEAKGYTNPTLMAEILGNLGIKFTRVFEDKGLVLKPSTPTYPNFGLIRVQWAGPWTREGVPIRARYRKTHWIATAVSGGSRGVFDINAIRSGGWISWNDWDAVLVPWILEHCVPRANGEWWCTHCWEVHYDSR